MAPGYDADLVIWDPEREFEVSIQSSFSFITCGDEHQLTFYK